MSTDVSAIFRAQYPEWAELCALGGQDGHLWMLDPYQKELIKARNVVTVREHWSETASPEAIQARKALHANLIKVGVRTGGEPPPLLGITVEEYTCRFCGGAWVLEREDNALGSDELCRRWQPLSVLETQEESIQSQVVPVTPLRRGRPKGSRTYPRDEFLQRYPTAYHEARDQSMVAGREPYKGEVANRLSISRETLNNHLQDYGLNFPPRDNEIIR